MHCSRRRLLRRGLECNACTINKSAHAKKSGNLFNDPRLHTHTHTHTHTHIYIYIYIFIYLIEHNRHFLYTYFLLILSNCTLVINPPIMMAQCWAESTWKITNYEKFINEFPPNIIRSIPQFERNNKKNM